MKVGEALTLRSQLQTRFQQLRDRLRSSVLVQEGEKPPEDPQTLLAELEQIAAQLETLVARMNRTNLAARLPDGRTLTDALARRDHLGLLQGALHQVAEAASANQQRYAKAELRIVRTVDGGAWPRRGPELPRERRSHDTRIQEANWQTDLAD
jgi:hypothetical protein